MLVRSAKLLHGTPQQYQALDSAIRTAQFVRNKCVRYWMDNRGVGRNDLYSHCKKLAKEFDFAKKLNSQARQASAERAWASISRFYINCKNKEAKKGYPKFKKNCRSVWHNSTFGQKGTGEKSRSAGGVSHTTGEICTSAMDGKPEMVSAVAEPVTRIPCL